MLIKTVKQHVQAASFQPFRLLCPDIDQEYRVCYYPLTVSSNSMDPGLRRVLIFHAVRKHFCLHDRRKDCWCIRKKWKSCTDFTSAGMQDFHSHFLVLPFFLYETACIFRHFSFFIVLHSFAFFPAKGQIFSLYIRISDPLTSSATPGSPAFALFWQYR